MTRRPGAERAGPVLLLVAALAAAVYLPSLRGAFVSDDAILVAGNPAVRSWSRALASFGRAYWYGLKGVQPYYRPLPILSYAIDHSVAGLEPLAYHATNAALHAGCALLAALLVLGLGRPRPRLPGADEPRPEADAGRHLHGSWTAGAAFAGALAAVHPLHSEPVAAIYGRPDLLAAFFTLAFMNLALRGRSLFALASLPLALLSKESAVGIPLLAPFALAAGTLWRRPASFSRRKAAAFTILSLAILAGYLGLRAQAVGLHVDPKAYTFLDNPLVRAEGLERWLTPVAVLGRYAALWLRPARLCADRGFDTVPLVASAGDPHFIAGAAILVLGAVALMALAASRSVWALPLAAAGLTILPASNLVVLSPALMGERFVYLPSLLVCVLLGGIYARLAASPGRAGAPARASGGRTSARWGLHAAAAVLIAAASGRTYVRAADFHDDLSLYESAASACPRSAKAQYNLGNALSRAKRDAEAIEAFRAAISVAPWMAVAHNNMGTAYLNLGRFSEAEEAYRNAAHQSPELLSPHESLAGLLYQDGRLQASLQEARLALSLNPNPAEAAQLEELIRRIESRLQESP